MKRQYRILHTLPDLMLGGGQKCVLNNLVYLDRELFINDVCYFLPCRDMERIFKKEGITPLFIEHRSFWSWPWALMRLIRFIRIHQIDLIHIQGPPLDKLYAQIAAILCRVPVVRTLQGIMPTPTSLYQVLKRPRPRSFYRAVKVRVQYALDCLLDPLTVRHVIAVSDSVFKSWWPYLRARGIRRNQITINHNAIPVKMYQASQDEETLSALRRDLQIPADAPVLINIARLTPGKGQQLLVEMMHFVIQRWPNARLLLVGDGEHKEQLQCVIRQADMSRNVLLLGRRNDIPALLALSDVFVFSSFFEGFPLTVLEALAAGKPVVATQLPPLQELHNQGTGIRLIDNRDANALADTVINILEDKKLMQELGRMGQQVVSERYNMTVSAKRLESVYLSVLDESI